MLPAFSRQVQNSVDKISKEEEREDPRKILQSTEYRIQWWNYSVSTRIVARDILPTELIHQEFSKKYYKQGSSPDWLQGIFHATVPRVSHSTRQNKAPGYPTGLPIAGFNLPGRNSTPTADLKIIMSQVTNSTDSFQKG